MFKNKMKKMLALLLAVGCVLTGCATGTNGTPSSEAQKPATQSSETQNVETQATEPKETVKVNVWTANSHSKSVYEAWANEWNQTRGVEVGVEIVYDVKEGNLNEMIDLGFQTGDAPDMFPMSSITKYASEGMIVSLDDLPGGKEFYERLCGIAGMELDKLTATWDGAYDGKIYFAPKGATIQGLVYNKEMFRAAGLVDENGEPTPPKTWDEFREYAKILTNTEKREYGVILPMKWSSWAGEMRNALNAYVGHTGWDYVNNTYDYSGLEPIYNTYVGIMEDGSCYPGAESLDNDPARARFAEGGIGMKMAYSYDVAVYNTQFPAQIEWGVAPIPVVDLDNMNMQYLKLTKGMVINSALLDKVSPEVAMEIYEYMNGEDIMRELYATGCEVPFDWSIVEGVEMKIDYPGWEDFCALASISKWGPSGRLVDISGERKVDADFVEKVMTGEMTAKEACDNYTKVQNNGVKKYQELHPEYNGDHCAIPDWDASRDNWMPEQ